MLLTARQFAPVALSQAETDIAITSAGEAAILPTANTPSVAPGQSDDGVTLASQEVAQWPAQKLALRVNETAEGRLDGDAGRLHDGTPFDLYEFEGAIGQYITLTVTSTAFDTYLILVAPDDTVVAFNDDANVKASTDSQLRLALPMSGAYQVWVNSFSGDTGEYHLSLAAMFRSEEDTALAVGETKEGWLLPGDELNSKGFYADSWTISMPDRPVVIQVTSEQFDTQLNAWTPDGKLLIANDDANFVAGDGNSRLVLAPSDDVPPGAPVLLEVTLPGQHAIGGAYQISALPLPETFEPEAVVQIRPVIVNLPTREQAAPLVTEAQLVASLRRASKTWQTCGIHIAVAEGEAISVVEIEGLQSPVEVEDATRDWTVDETLLQMHPTHAAYEERRITLYVVPALNGLERYGVAYPSTRYPAGRSGVVVVAAQAIAGHEVGAKRREISNVLAHEIGHILGLEHPNPLTGDGDPWNDDAQNLMSANAAGDGLTPLQCLVARGESHYLHPLGPEPLLPPAFMRTDRVLLVGERIAAALTTSDVEASDGSLLDVYYFAGTAGDKVRIQLESAMFDPVLLLDAPNGERIAVDDDSGDGWNAELILTLPEDGDYSIGITSFARGVGGYQLALLPGP